MAVHYHWTMSFRAPRVVAIARRRPVLAVTSALAIPLIAVAAGLAWWGGWAAKALFVWAAGMFALDVIWLADEWVREWRRETWRRRLARPGTIVGVTTARMGGKSDALAEALDEWFDTPSYDKGTW